MVFISLGSWHPNSVIMVVDAGTLQRAASLFPAPSPTDFEPGSAAVDVMPARTASQAAEFKCFFVSSLLFQPNDVPRPKCDIIPGLAPGKGWGSIPFDGLSICFSRSFSHVHGRP